MMKTKIILIRHGEPRYDEVLERNYFGMGFDLGKLTDRGVLQAESRAKDPLLKGATMIVSSPYTRALQTAAIISRITQIPLSVENDLHEWMPDTAFKFDFDMSKSYDEYMSAKGIREPHHNYRWESYDVLSKRVYEAIKKYQDHEKIIVVCHGIVMSTLTRFDDIIEHCGVREVELTWT
jgi:broad specificity phosphatase PhoE